MNTGSSCLIQACLFGKSSGVAKGQTTKLTVRRYTIISLAENSENIKPLKAKIISLCLAQISL